jgi:hypothetical protein
MATLDTRHTLHRQSDHQTLLESRPFASGVRVERATVSPWHGQGAMAKESCDTSSSCGAIVHEGCGCQQQGQASEHTLTGVGVVWWFALRQHARPRHPRIQGCTSHRWHATHRRTAIHTAARAQDLSETALPSAYRLAWPREVERSVSTLSVVPAEHAHTYDARAKVSGVVQRSKAGFHDIYIR